MEQGHGMTREELDLLEKQVEVNASLVREVTALNKTLSNGALKTIRVQTTVILYAVLGLIVPVITLLIRG